MQKIRNIESILCHSFIWQIVKQFFVPNIRFYIDSKWANHLQNLGLLSTQVNNLLDEQQPAQADVSEISFCIPCCVRLGLKEVILEVERLENDLCKGVQESLNHVPCPVPGARLAFYITSLTKPDTTEQRNARKQLQLALPLNLFLSLRVRKWTSFYVQNLSINFI